MRNRYLDLLRAAAIVRVVVYHHFGWPWLSIVFPAMGVMFAVAGSLTAASLRKRSAGPVVTSRMRRLLPPVWLLGLLAVPAMIGAGWTGETGGEHPFRPATLLFWVLPLGDPPGSDEAAFVWDALWYVRTYLWLVVLSPLLHPVFKRVGWPLLAAPLLLMLVLEHGDFGMPAAVESALWDLATYGACWLAGFAHRDGRLAKLHPATVGVAFLALAGTGVYWLVQGHAETGWDLNEASEAQAVYSLAFVLLVLRWQPSMTRVEGVPVLRRSISLLNARAVTVYLWHGVAIAVVWPVLEFVGMDEFGKLEGVVTLGVTVAATAVAVVLFGWAEDLAARRRPRVWPVGEKPAPAPGPAPEAGAPLPAGWPEVGRDGTPVERGRYDDLSRAVTVDMPVAGRPVPGFAPRSALVQGPLPGGPAGVPRAGHSPAQGRAPGQHRPADQPESHHEHS